MRSTRSEVVILQHQSQSPTAKNPPPSPKPQTSAHRRPPAGGALPSPHASARSRCECRLELRREQNALAIWNSVCEVVVNCAFSVRDGCGYGISRWFLSAYPYHGGARLSLAAIWRARDDLPRSQLGRVSPILISQRRHLADTRAGRPPGNQEGPNRALVGNNYNF